MNHYEPLMNHIFYVTGQLKDVNFGRHGVVGAPGAFPRVQAAEISWVESNGMILGSNGFVIMVEIMLIIPICSMSSIFTYIWVIFRANVGKYSIHGAYGI